MKKLGLICLSALGLISCGGGGSGSSSSETTTTVDNSQTNVYEYGTKDTPEYNSIAGTVLGGSATAQLDSFNRINSVLETCGFNQRKQNTLLDKAALNHAKYLLANTDDTVTNPHNELNSRSGYTGAEFSDRLDYVGYKYNSVDNFSTEVINGIYGDSSVTTFSDAVDTLLGAPYHLNGMFFNNEEVGIAHYAEEADTQNGVQYIIARTVINIASQRGHLAPDLKNTPLTFPCNGITDTTYNNVNEVPMPTINGVEIADNWGQPILVVGNTNETVLVSYASYTAGSDFRDTNNGKIKLLTYTNDSQKLLLKNEVNIIPVNSLDMNTTYSVSIDGTIDGRVFNRSFSFTTGSI